MPEILVVNESTVMTDEQVKDIVAALNIQLQRDFASVWGLGGTVVFWPKAQPIPAGKWQLAVLDNSDQAGALGYHETTIHGDPLGKVFAKDDLNDGASVSVTMSHELLEMRADPRINQSAENDNPNGSIRFYAWEVGDAVEDDPYGYEITTPDGKAILVSDFVTPLWFDSADQTSGPYDFRSHVKKPLELLPNGYIGILDAGSGAGWTQLTDRFDSHEKELRSVPKPGSRRQRRAMGRQNWRKSTAHTL